MKIKITSLGCRLNQSEADSISTLLQMRGHEITSGNDADIFIINACAVTLRSERKTRQIMYRAMNFTGKDQPERIIVTGCSGEDIVSHKSITYISNDHKYLIPDLVEGNISPEELRGKSIGRFQFTPPVKSSTNRVNLKIQDGCDNFCAFCIIPSLRGKPQSKPVNQIKEEFRQLLDHGYREIILSGVNIGKYHDNGHSLAFLVSELLNFGGDYRIHLTSMDPELTDNELINLFKASNMVKHLHLSLQSGSNTVLQRMNRAYTAKKYLEVVEGLKSIDEDFNFTTDIIVGFPGETPEEFQETQKLVQKVGFSHIHTFRFSPRPETVAASMPQQVKENIKTERSMVITKLFREQKKCYYEKFNKRESILLTEKVKGEVTTGHNEYYIPIEVNRRLHRNRFYPVLTMVKESGNILDGNIIENHCTD